MSRRGKLAKLSAPHPARVLARPRLFQLLRSARHRRVLWIVAPPGAGKTALVASWLRRCRARHLWLQLDEGDGDVATFFHYLRLSAGGRGLPAFAPAYLEAPGAYARRLLRTLCARPRAPRALILDDYHELPPDSPVHAALVEGLAELPEGTTAVVMSRGEPPAAMARLLARGQLELLRAEELRLTRGEAVAVARLWGYTRHEWRSLEAGAPPLEGWAAGLVLLLAGGRRDPAGAGPDRWREALFGYFGEEILRRAPPGAREVLVATALLPQVGAADAVRLTGVARAGEILADLARRGCFVVAHPGAGPRYRYHALFRAFLLERLERTFPPARCAELRRRATALLEEAGEVEEALALHAGAGAGEDAARLVRAAAPGLLRANRLSTVRRWIEGLPAALREGDPWLLLWWGRALLPGDPAAADRLLARAYDGFRAAGEPAGTYLALAARADACCYGLDDLSPLDGWIELLSEVRRRFPAFPDREVEAQVVVAAFTALSYRQPWHPALPEWEEQALALALGPGDPGLRWKAAQALLVHYAWWAMDLSRARLVTEALRPLSAARQADPASALLWHLAAADLRLYLAQPEAALRITERGLALAAESGVRRWDPYLLAARGFAARACGDLDAAREALDRLASGAGRETRLGQAVYHFGACILSRRRGQVEVAREHGRLALEVATRSGSPLAEIACGLGAAMAARPGAQEPALRRVLEAARRCGARFYQAGALLGLALLALRRGEGEAGLAQLREGFAAGRALGTLSYPWLLPAELAECCARALEREIEPEHVVGVIRAERLAPGEAGRSLEAWPWALRVEALGGLAVVRDGERVRGGRKAQKKPLELLGLLVGAGPGGAGQDALAEALWPDAEGDAARRALKTTVYRLRRLLGDPAAVAQQEGRLALDPDRVFVDLWALARLLDRIEAARTGPEERAALRARLRGPWRAALAGAEQRDGLDPHRAQLRRRLQRALDAARS